MDASQWQKLLQMTFDDVNTYPDTASIAQDISRVKAVYKIKNQPEYDYSLEFSEEGLKYTAGRISNPTIQLVYPNLQVLIETFSGLIPPAGSHAVIAGVEFQGQVVHAVLLSSLALSFCGGFLTAQATIESDDE